MNARDKLGIMVSSLMAIVLVSLATAFLGYGGGPCEGLPCAGGQKFAERPSRWAKPLLLAGVCNLHQVSDDLYRSAQPTAEGLRNLKDKANGINTIVSLCSFHSDYDTEPGYEHIKMKAWHPEEEDIIKFLRIVTNNKKTPVLVHCTHGADRTGTMCAVYRIVVQGKKVLGEKGWTKQEALQEMTAGGFCFHTVWRDLTQWIEGLDDKKVARIRAAVGIKEDYPQAQEE